MCVDGLYGKSGKHAYEEGSPLNVWKVLVLWP